jgi:hypothetical protein
MADFVSLCGNIRHADSEVPHCLAEFMTLKDRSRLSDVYADGNQMPNFNCKNFKD